MKTYRLALIGFGNVGQGFAQILQERGNWLLELFGVNFEIVAVCTRSRGSLYDPGGLEINALLDSMQSHNSLSGIRALHNDWDALQIAGDSNADVLVEISYTDLETGEPATQTIRRALETGKHVVTANKGPTALHYPELLRIARENGVEIGVEGTVMSGTPALNLGLGSLAGAGVRKIQGILNGTTNYILTQMESGASYADALAQAQEKGYAEADPTADVEAYDAAAKVVILANTLMNLPLTMADINRTGISELTSDDIEQARGAGERWKLIGMVEKQTTSGYVAQVKPTRLPVMHPLASVSGATNAITYTTEVLGDVTLIGPGAGRQETGYGLLADLLAIHRNSG
jgi:homoserine dehydrogenase